MVHQEQIRPGILAIGSPLMVNRLASKIDSERLHITACYNTAAAADLLAHETFDLIIIDNLIRNARVVCRSAYRRANVPVALFLQGKPVDWQDLWTHEVDAFLADAGTNAEFTARVQACLRRKLASSPNTL